MSDTAMVAMSSFQRSLDESLPKKSFLSIADICESLTCEESVVYNWNKRSDPARRPRRVKVGKEVRYPRTEFIVFLVKEQGRS